MKLNRSWPALAVILTLIFAVSPLALAATPWTFAVSGDSRNCGNVVMPAIAKAVQDEGARFYWHLGDLRRIRGIDEDYVRESRFTSPPSLDSYLKDAWRDFGVHQVAPFGRTPFFLGIGNHETIAPKTREEFRDSFQSLLDRRELRAQRDTDTGRVPAATGAGAPTYYHWRANGVDFINLDNATGDRFDPEQLRWFDAVLAAVEHDRGVRTIVVGMHEALPHSFADSHSMCGSSEGIESGEHVYRRLVEAERHGKRVYVLASHSHYYLEALYDTSYWRDPRHGGVVLPGWIVGTAGAVRYPLPPEITPGPAARTHVYGYLSGRVAPDGTITFQFRELNLADLERSCPADYTPEDVQFCFADNPPPATMGVGVPAPSCLAPGEEH